MTNFKAEDFRSLLNQINEAIDSSLTSPAQPVVQETQSRKQQALQILADIRKTAKASELIGSQSLPDNFANQVAEGLWRVISWLQTVPEPEAAPVRA
jgi:hypothetical protein